MGDVLATMCSTVLQFIVLQILLLFARSGESVRCFECNDVPSPISCGEITRCASSESCFIEQVITTSGNVVYNSGCESNSRCAALSGRRSITKRNSDIVTCRECCQGNHCNNRGCGVPEIDRTQRGVYCYTCPYLKDPAACESVSICTTNERCLTHIRTEYLGLQDNTIYMSECEHAQACQTIGSLGRGNCCDQDFCNDHYNLTRATNPPTNVPTAAVTETPTAAVTETPTTAVTETPTAAVTETPSTAVTETPTAAVTETPTAAVTDTPTTRPSTPADYQCDLSGGYDHHPLQNNDQLCIKVFDQNMDWEQAKDVCNSDNARLVVLNTQEKLNVVKDMLSQTGGANYWIGLRDRDHRNKYYWLNDERLSDADWGNHQPDYNFHGKNEDCVLLYRDDLYRMHDSICSNHNSYICERV